MKAPISFVYGNLVFGAAGDDVWAAFAIRCTSYEWLSGEAKNARLLALMGALEALEADVQILRVGRSWDLAGYVRELEQTGGGVHVQANQRYAREHAERLSEVGCSQPALFLLVSLREPERDIASYVSHAAEQHPREWLRTIARALSPSDRRLLKASTLEDLRVRADQAHARLADFLSARPARGVELQWLVRRAFCRGLGEPLVEGLHEPRALAFERNGEALLAPLEGDVVRWLDGYDALIGERESLENLLGATFVFGMRSEAEAARALTLLGLDPEDRRARERLLEMQAGRCLLRDHSGRVEAIQVEVVAPSLLRAFSTTPTAELQ
ncbi:MAG TPA: ATP-binding protein [Solirubrobacteraceae bacterium]|nr:ATP-binding protein [Solirubrobacteraceae bacterium]